MPNLPDPFDKIIAGAHMGEWPDPGYETIPPYRVAELQDALLDHMVAADASLHEDEEGRRVLRAQLERLVRVDVDRLGVLRTGDSLKFSGRGFLMSADETGGLNCDLIDSGVYVKGTVVDSIVMPAVVLDSLQFSDDTPEPFGDEPMTQLSVCVELRDVVVGSDDYDDHIEEQPFEEDAGLMCVPLIYEGLKIQRKL